MSDKTAPTSLDLGVVASKDTWQVTVRIDENNCDGMYLQLPDGRVILDTGGRLKEPPGEQDDLD